MAKNPFDQFDEAAVSPVENPFDKFDSTAQQEPKQPSFTSDIADALSNRAGNIGKIFQAPANESVIDSFIKSPGRALQTAGQVAGGFNDAVGEALKAGYRNIVPQRAQDAISSGINSALQTAPGQGLLSGARAIGEGYGAVKKSFPEGMANVEAVGNIMGVLPSGFAAKKAAEGSKMAFDMVSGAVTPMQTAEKIDKMINSSIVNNYKKGIKPSVVGQSDAGLVAKHYDNVKTAVKDIVDNSPVPLSKSENILEDFSGAVKTTKKKLWDEATAISKANGENGVTIDLTPVIDDLYKIGIEDNAQRLGKTAKIDKIIKDFEQAPTEITPQQAEELLANLNNKSKSFFRDPNMQDEGAIYARMADITKKQLSDSFEGLDGVAYNDFRKRYGSQLAIEKEVTDRATQYGRKAEYGLYDIANIPTAMEFARSLGRVARGDVGGGVAGMGSALTGLAAKYQIKQANDSANIIRKMFKDVETLTALKNKIKTLPPEY